MAPEAGPILPIIQRSSDQLRMQVLLRLILAPRRDTYIVPKSVGEEPSTSRLRIPQTEDEIRDVMFDLMREGERIRGKGMMGVEPYEDVSDDEDEGPRFQFLDVHSFRLPKNRRRVVYESQPQPSNYNVLVKEVVASTLADFAYDPTKLVIINYYSSLNMDERKEDVMNEAAQFFTPYLDVVFGRIDIAANNTPMLFEGPSSIKVYPRGDSEVINIVAGSSAGLVRFLHGVL